MGLYTLNVLENIEKRLGGPLYQYFDLISGTSVGGLIGMGVALGRPIGEVKEVFERYGPMIFHVPIWRRNNTVAGLYHNLWNSKYTAEKLALAIDCIVPQGTTLKDTKVPLLIPAVNVSQGRPREFRNARDADLEHPLKDLALATTAAPTYFPISAVGGDYFADGGLYANTPDLILLMEAMHMRGAQSDDISMLSVGTTYQRKGIAQPSTTGFGISNWLSQKLLIDTMIASQEHTSIFLAQRMLKDRYLRLNAHLSEAEAKSVALDKAGNPARQVLASLAQTTFERAEERGEIDALIGLLQR